MEEIFVIVGLGNPGTRYENTRHNVGFEAIASLSAEFNIDVSKTKFKGIMGEGKINDKKVILLAPLTYMNLSGECVVEVLNWYKVDTQNLIVVYDDIDIELGKVRIRPKGSSGTHNGMKSVIQMLNKDNFPRVRIGIGRPLPNFDLADYVLSKIRGEDRKIMDEAVKEASKAVVEILNGGIDKAMNLYNK